jgi:hypothetical protein
MNIEEQNSIRSEACKTGKKQLKVLPWGSKS